MQDITVAEDYISGIYNGKLYYIPIILGFTINGFSDKYSTIVDKFVENLSSQNTTIKQYTSDNDNIIVILTAEGYTYSMHQNLEEALNF